MFEQDNLPTRRSYSDAEAAADVGRHDAGRHAPVRVQHVEMPPRFDGGREPRPEPDEPQARRAVDAPQIVDRRTEQRIGARFAIIVQREDVHLVAARQPFEKAGSLHIYPASTCVRAVASGGCAAPMPANADVPTLDPEEACQHAIDAGMVMHRAHPLSCETSLDALVGGVVADRLPRRLVMIGSDTAGLCVRCAMGALLVSGHARVWELVALQALGGVAVAGAGGGCAAARVSISSR